MKRMLAAIMAMMLMFGCFTVYADEAGEYPGEYAWNKMSQAHHMFFYLMMGDDENSGVEYLYINETEYDEESGVIFSFATDVYFAVIPEGDAIKNVAIMSNSKSPDLLYIHWMAVLMLDLFELSDEDYAVVSSQAYVEIEEAVLSMQAGEAYRSDFCYVNDNISYYVETDGEYLSCAIYYEQPVDKTAIDDKWAAFWERIAASSEQ